LLLPEKNRQNNLTGSFNWFQPKDTQRGEGETHSIIQMIEHMVREYDIDPRQEFITGLSAGGAMALVLLSTYPDVFAAGAIIAGYGLPQHSTKSGGDGRQRSVRAKRCARDPLARSRVLVGLETKTAAKRGREKPSARPPVRARRVG
jgi:poly(hydroxyalkanoate) depolymerase family esterase